MVQYTVCRHICIIYKPRRGLYRLIQIFLIWLEVRPYCYLYMLTYIWYLWYGLRSGHIKSSMLYCAYTNTHTVCIVCNVVVVWKYVMWKLYNTHFLFLFHIFINLFIYLFILNCLIARFVYEFSCDLDLFASSL